MSMHTEQWLLFIDADCEIKAEVLDFLASQMRHSEKKSIWAGLYENPKKTSYLQRVHNLIANRWVLNSFQEKSLKPKYFLGGAFLIYSQTQMTVFLDYFSELKFWGAEDKQLAFWCQQAGYEVILSESFKVIHHTSNSWAHFIKRAWLHGKNDPFFLKEKIKFINPLDYLIWIQKLEKSDWHLVPAMALHFLIQKGAKLIHSIHLKSN